MEFNNLMVNKIRHVKEMMAFCSNLSVTAHREC